MAKLHMSVIGHLEIDDLYNLRFNSSLGFPIIRFCLESTLLCDSLTLRFVESYLFGVCYDFVLSSTLIHRSVFVAGLHFGSIVLGRT